MGVDIRKASDITITGALNIAEKSVVRERFIPSQLCAGWPMISSKNGAFCATVPYYGLQRDGERYLLYPLSHIIMLTLDNGRVIKYSDLTYESDYKDVAFTKPCGSFKHEAIADYTRGRYRDEKASLLSLYDELLATIRRDEAFPKLQEMRDVFSRLMEPGEYPFYCRLAPKFFANYCGTLA